MNAVGQEDEPARCFAPVVNADTRVLILGSLPGVASLAAQQYYAHPRNQFWPLLAAVLAQPELPALDYPQRLARLQAHGVGLWDVVAQAQRRGSLDTAIRAAQRNDLAQLVASLPALRMVAFNGATAARAADQLTGFPALTVLRLPSSSPAYTLALAEKQRAWQALAEAIVR